MNVADTGPLWYEPNYEGSPVVFGPPAHAPASAVSIATPPGPGTTSPRDT